MAFVKLKLILLIITCLCCVNCELNLDEGSACVSEGLNGTCVSVYRCESAAALYIYSNAGYDLLTSPYIYNFNYDPLDKLRDDPKFPEICSYNEGIPIVCCTDCMIYDEEKFKDYIVTVGGSFEKKMGPKVHDKCMDRFQVLPYRCRGAAFTTFNKYIHSKRKCHMYRIHIPRALIGGREAVRREFPHMALLGFGDDERNASWLCGGTIISERYILTAAHCLFSREHGPLSFAALGILKRNDPEEYWKIYKIRTRHRHPDYKPPSMYHDIALLETETEINFGRNILPACLNTDEFNTWEAEAPGWGELGDQMSLSDALQVGELDHFSDEDCSLQFPEDSRYLSRGYDHATQMCYGRHNKIVDTCHGDSGGPLHVSELLMGRPCLFTVVGVTSFGTRNCGVPGVPGMFTRVVHYVPWIESIVWPD